MKKIGYLATLIIILMQQVFAAGAPAVKKLPLSLHDAILLAVRENPNIQQAHLNYLNEKFSLQVQQWQFHPHFSFQASMQRNRYGVSGESLSTSNTLNAQPGVSLLTPFGASVTVLANNTKTPYYNTGLSVQISAPLMRGFGTAVVESALNNAKDSDVISRLNIEGSLRATVTAVI